MVMRFAAREVLVLVTEDDCSGQSNSENREGIDESIRAYRGKIRFSTLELLWEKPFQDQDLVASESLGFLRMNYRKKIT